MKVYYDKDCDLSLIKGKKVAIIGYGSQGHAHAQNLHDSGVDVVVGVRKDGASWKKVEAAGLKVATIEDATTSASFVASSSPRGLGCEIFGHTLFPFSGIGNSFYSGDTVFYEPVRY